MLQLLLGHGKLRHRCVNVLSARSASVPKLQPTTATVFGYFTLYWIPIGMESEQGFIQLDHQERTRSIRFRLGYRCGWFRFWNLVVFFHV